MKKNKLKTEFLKKLNQLYDRTEALDFLYDIMVEKNEKLISSMIKIIGMPKKIEDSHAFALLLIKQGYEEYIDPLIKGIEESKVLHTPWLDDYLFALGQILDEQQKYDHPFSDSFVKMIGEWMIDDHIKELSEQTSFYCASVLSNIGSPICKDYYLKVVKDQSEFSQTRIYCLNGLMTFYGKRYMKLYKSLLKDKDLDFRHGVFKGLEWLNEKYR